VLDSEDSEDSPLPLGLFKAELTIEELVDLVIEEDLVELNLRLE